MEISPPTKWKPDGHLFSVHPITFHPSETKADIREFAREIFGRFHCVLWVVDDPLGDYRHARIWHGVRIYHVQTGAHEGCGDLFGSKRNLTRLYSKYLRKQDHDAPHAH